MPAIDACCRDVEACPGTGDETCWRASRGDGGTLGENGCRGEGASLSWVDAV